MSQVPLEQTSPTPQRRCRDGCERCGCQPQGASSQVEPHDELLRFAASADELAQRIRDGHGTDLARLIGDAVQSRAA